MRIENGGSGPRLEDAERPDLQEVLEHYGAHVYHSGKIICIFHEETQPSLSVDLSEQLFKCFSCGAAGDSFTAIMLKEECDFKGARAYASSAGFTGAADDRGSKEVSGFLGRRRPGVSRDEGARPTRRVPWSRSGD